MTKKRSSAQATALRPPRFPTRDGLQAIYRPLMRRPNVVGCFVGRRRRNGRLTKAIALVCCVRQKVANAVLSPRARVPEEIRWLRTKRRVATVKTDIQHLGESGYMTFVGPGDVMTAPAKATLGMVLKHPHYGTVVTTAGHAFIPNGYGSVTFADGPVTLLNVPGDNAPIAARVVKAVVRENADYALLQTPSACRNSYQDFYTVSALHWPTEKDIDRPLLVLTARGFQETKLRGFAATLKIESVIMEGLLLTDPVIEAGDSGCALVDTDFRLWGLLVGYARIEGQLRAVFAAADWPVYYEEAQLV